MLGSLTQLQCEYILTRGNIGRLGCSLASKPYIVPITYIYDSGFVYGHAYDGMKIKIMRKNPNVCFQAEDIDSLTSWRSVVAFGQYEELKTTAQQQKARALFMERLFPLTLGESVSPARELANPPHHIEKKLKPVIFRIRITEITGRFEKQVLG
jgi:nitroimidazol reductase NimA-like FMN-containing flavoprotein (pyridoxamine 5'-phosphate oxidase superfamily)